MPAVSVKQRRFFGWAEHNPAQAAAEGVKPNMTHGQMHDFAATPEKGLPMKAKPPKKPRIYKGALEK
jgi:hypothetical protein